MRLGLCAGGQLCPYCANLPDVRWQKSSARLMSGEPLREAVCRIPETVLASILARPSQIWGQTFECLCGAVFSVESFAQDSADQSSVVILRELRGQVSRDTEIGWLDDEKSDPIL